MTATVADPSARLRELLARAASEPRALADALAAERTALADGQPDLAPALYRAELERLQSFAAGAGAPAELREAVQRARDALLELRMGCLERSAEGDPAALFDLAELRAECLHAGLADLAERCRVRLEERIAAAAGSERLVQEAQERVAALATGEEDLPLEHRILLLRENAALLGRLGRARRNRRLRAQARRLRAAAADRELMARLERLLGRRGAAWLERISFALLVVVLALVFVDLTVPLSPDLRHALLWGDAAICALFIGEFALKFALAPARGSWFVRNAVTDLLPAIPAVLFLLPSPPGLSEAGDTVAARALRLFRITWAARYVQALRPLLRLLRFLLLLVRGMDGLVRRFAPLLNRDFLFFEPPLPDGAAEPRPLAARRMAFGALRREFFLLRQLQAEERAAGLLARARRLLERAQSATPVPSPVPAEARSVRDVPVEQVVEFLWRLQPEDLGQHLVPSDVAALDRVARVVSAPVVRSMPLARRLRVVPLPATPEERVVAMGRRVAEWLERWQHRLQFVADLHGIMTGPQILDRVASAMVQLTQRPALRLLLFGGAFLLLQWLVGENCLSRFVGLPLIVLGSVCFVFLVLGWWLKRIAGEAADSFRMTSEAHFVSLLHLVKRRREREDLEFLGARVFRGELPPARAAELLQRRAAEIRAGAALDGPPAEAAVERDVDRTALLYLHFLDGAILHESDVKTTEQLMANLSLENIRSDHLKLSPRERKRLRRLRLDDGSLFSGPYLWFRFITESVAVETAKRITEYNRRCLTLEQRGTASPMAEQALSAWLMTRREAARGRTLERTPPPGAGAYRTTEFNALDFLWVDPERERHLRRLFGDEVVDTVQVDRRNMIREIFGTRPAHRLPRAERSFNAYRFYMSRLSMGRVFLLPLASAWRFVRGCGWVVGRLRQIVREIVLPELAMQRRESGEAPFAVALRKIHRMKAPGLLEATRTRARIDPSYSGAPSGWTGATAAEPVSELERDLDFLLMRERDRALLRSEAALVRTRAVEWQAMAARFADLWPDADPAQRRAGELAVVVAYVTDRDRLRMLLLAERWFQERLPAIRLGPVPGSLAGDLLRLLVRAFGKDPVGRWLSMHGAPLRLGFGERLRLRRAWAADHLGTRAVLDAWLALPPGETPLQRARQLLSRAWRDRDDVRRELAALRAVQTLSVLDVRNYRDLVFRLGGYAADGERPGLATALP